MRAQAYVSHFTLIVGEEGPVPGAAALQLSYEPASAAVETARLLMAKAVVLAALMQVARQVLLSCFTVVHPDNAYSMSYCIPTLDSSVWSMFIFWLVSAGPRKEEPPAGEQCFRRLNISLLTCAFLSQPLKALGHKSMSKSAQHY